MIFIAILGFLLSPFVQTKEDLENRQFYERIYEKNKKFLVESSSGEERIPKTLHFICLGNQDAPKHIEKWKAKYPHWHIKVWIDSLVDEDLLGDLVDRYYLANTLEEKTEILSYAILYKEGGVYVANNLLPKKKLDHLNEQFDFYCELAKPGPSVLSTSVFPNNHLLAARPGHPVFLHAIHHQVLPLIEGVKAGIDKNLQRDIVLPPSETWVKKEKSPESKTHKMLRDITRSNNQTLLIVLCAFVLNSVFVVFLFKKLKRT